MMKRFALTILIAVFASVGTHAQEIITLSQGRNIVTEKVTPLYRPTGPSLRISIGVPGLITTALNYQITPWLMAGGGVGYGLARYTVHYHIPTYFTRSGNKIYLVEERENEYIQTGYAIPWYAEAELRTPKYKWSFLFNVKLGVNIGVKTPYLEEHAGQNFYTTDYQGYAVFSETTIKWHTLFAATSVGFGFKNFSMGLGVGLQGGKRYADLHLSYNIPFSSRNSAK